ncbi:MAG: aldo/keto reductase [Janthinobacterium lividum]|jgi:diketogulonate reductase-like aldo/keto reductase
MATRWSVTPAQVALVWVLHEDHVLPIPEAGRVTYVQQNRTAADLNLSLTDRAELHTAIC